MQAQELIANKHVFTHEQITDLIIYLMSLNAFLVFINLALAFTAIEFIKDLKKYINRKKREREYEKDLEQIQKELSGMQP